MTSPDPQFRPSMPPRGMSWPMVGYAFVRELTSIAMVIGWVVIVIVVAHTAPPYTIHSLIGAVASAFGAGLQRSKPAEAIDLSRWTGN